MLPEDPLLRDRLLRSARLLLDWSQARLACEIGSSRATVHAMEFGPPGPRVSGCRGDGRGPRAGRRGVHAGRRSARPWAPLHASRVTGRAEAASVAAGIRLVGRPPWTWPVANAPRAASACAPLSTVPPCFS